MNIIWMYLYLLRICIFLNYNSVEAKALLQLQIQFKVPLCVRVCVRACTCVSI